MEQTLTTPRTVLLAGATSAAGVAITRALMRQGAQVLAVGSNQQRLDDKLSFATARFEADLGDETQVQDLAQRVHATQGRIDALLHLVGGWRGGKGIPGQTDADYQFLHRSVMTTLRHTTKVFYQDLLDSPAGRLGIVSSQAVSTPTPSNANYGAVKAAAEFWVQAIARDFSKQAPQAAASIWVVKALTDQRPQAPGSKLAGFTHVDELAAAACELLHADPAHVNGERIVLPGLE
ncbi:SDR family NAD(P)-dependent oxidoreductase [Glutamicibacter uratoxydans]|uniref:SDR family NAD(P)-dependent oxidoreductase n=1 Tax=Glutamicibacter uratoxydans TaxID=43667 RepID=UPI003D6F334E